MVRSRQQLAIARLSEQIKCESYRDALRRARRLVRWGNLLPSEQFEVICLETEILARLGDASSAAANLSNLRHRASSPREHIRLRFVEGLTAVTTGSARNASSAAVDVIQRLNSDTGVDPLSVAARNVLGVALYRMGRYRWARSAFEDCAAFYRLKRDHAALAEVLINISLVVKNSGRIDLALDMIDEATRLLPGPGYGRAWTAAFVTRAICLLRLGRIDAALASLLQARQVARVQRVFTIAVSNNLGHVYRMRGAYPVAVEFYSEALQCARTEGAVRSECLAMEFLAETAYESGSPGEAVRLLDEALALAERVSGAADLAMEVLRRRGEAHLALGHQAEGRADLERAMRMCKARGERREGILTERAFHFAFAPAAELPSKIRGVLESLRDIDDRFEYVRTVCFALERGFRLEDHEWFHDAYVAAAHYVSTSGLAFWRKRLEQAAGYRTALTPKQSAAANDKLTPSDAPVPTTSRSLRYLRTLEATRVAARSSEPALVLGETGTGKEVISRLVHGWSARAAKPLIAVNCGAIPENLIESEIFGHTRGAFTGASKERMGLFEAASGGSVLLDEIGDLPMQMQVKLLRFLDNYEVRRIGAHTTRRVDVRVIAATNRDLRQLVADGRFRSDLFFRLNVFRIEIPALRERREDIPDLVYHYLHDGAHSGLPIQVADDLMQWFQNFDWPGNIRELRNLCRYLSAHAWGKPQIQVADLPEDFLNRAALATGEVTEFERENTELQREQIERALHQTGGTIIAAARLLHLGRNSLSRKMREFGIDREDFKNTPTPR